jgi:hypothetical protein
MPTQAERLLGAQLAISVVLVESSALDQAASALLKGVCENAGWDFGAIWLVDSHADVLRCSHVWHAESAALARFERVSQSTAFKRGVGLPGRVWAAGKPAWIPDVLEDANFPRVPAATEAGLHAAFCFPVVDRSVFYGVTEFLCRESRTADQPLLNAMTDMGIRIGQFMARLESDARREDLVRQLQETLARVKVLTGMLPMCASCKKIRDDKGRWNALEQYITSHTDAAVTHGICPECAARLYPSLTNSKPPTSR